MLNRDALLFSPTREGVPSSDDNFYASDLIAAQEALEEEAREAVPYRFDACTYDLGYIKQPLFACRTCLNHRAVCAACSVACHGEHDLIELFNRRNFRCDCGTESMGAGSCCSISLRNDAPANLRNKYDANFEGRFCFCGRPYDPQTESDDMLQCLHCEDWCHAQCLGLPHSDDDSPAAPLRQDDFDQLICWRCVQNDAAVRHIAERYAGVEGTGVILLDKGDKVLGKIDLPAEEVSAEEAQSAGASASEPAAGTATDEACAAQEKPLRAATTSTSAHPSSEPTIVACDSSPAPLSTSGLQNSTKRHAMVGSDDGSAPKKAKVEHSDGASTTASASKGTCSAPPSLDAAESPVRRLMREGLKPNVFLQDGWMSRWCRCSQCLPMFVNLPYLLEEEDVFEPPEDPDAHKSTFDLGMEHLLNRMPRDQALDSVRAFTTLSDRLKTFLRPHAEGGTTVTKEHIQAFFDAEQERRQQQHS